MRTFAEYARERDQQIEEGVWDLAKGGIAGIGNTVVQGARGLGNTAYGLGKMGVGTAQTLNGLRQGSQGWSSAKQGLKNVAGGLGNAMGGATQIATAPVAGAARGVMAANQIGLGKPTAGPGVMGRVGNFFGLSQPGNSTAQQKTPANATQATPGFNQQQWQSQVASLIKQLDQQGPKGLGGWLGLKQAADKRLNQFQSQPKSKTKAQSQPGLMPPPAPYNVASYQYARNPQAYPQTGQKLTPTQQRQAFFDRNPGFNQQGLKSTVSSPVVNLQGQKMNNAPTGSTTAQQQGSWSEPNPDFEIEDTPSGGYNMYDAIPDASAFDDSAPALQPLQRTGPSKANWVLDGSSTWVPRS